MQKNIKLLSKYYYLILHIDYNYLILDYFAIKYYIFSEIIKLFCGKTMLYNNLLIVI